MNSTDDRSIDGPLAPAYWLSIGVLGILVAASAAMFAGALVRIAALAVPSSISLADLGVCFVVVLALIFAMGACHHGQLGLFLSRHATATRTVGLGIVNMVSLAVLCLLQ